MSLRKRHVDMDQEITIKVLDEPLLARSPRAPRWEAPIKVCSLVFFTLTPVVIYFASLRTVTST